MKNRINIVFGCSRKYAKYAVVMLQSLFENNTKNFIKLYVMVDEDLGKWRYKIENIVKKYGNDIQFVLLPSYKRKNEMKKFYPSSMNTDRWMAIEMMPENVERFLMLGIDVLVKGDLWEWYSVDFENKYMIMCKDQIISLYDNSDEDWVRKLKSYNFGRLDENYGNSDVVLVNSNLKEIFSFQKMINTILDKQLSMVDQDYFNIYMGKYIKFIEPYEYNYLAGMGCYEEVIDNIKILHYALKKPWEDYNDTPWENMWIDCARRTQGGEEAVQEHEDYVSDRRYVLWKYNCKYHNLLNNWMDIRDKGGNIFDGHNYSSVALFGAGRMCKHLLSDLNQTKIECKGIYDKNDDLNRINGIPISHNLEEYLESIREVDALIVTPVSEYDEIELLLESKTTRKIVSIDEMIKGCKKI